MLEYFLNEISQNKQPSGSNMGVKISLCNIALRAQADPFPPVACTGIINYLRRAGFEAEFFDIDSRRPSEKTISEYFVREKFDIVGISAVVSTGYAYTKNLAHLIKKACPQTKIIVGGNLVATHEVLLRKCEIDICVIGEGEKVMLALVRYFDQHKGFFPSTDELKSIKGIAFLDENDQVVHTGTGELVEQNDLPQPDYDILAMHDGVLGSYVRDPLLRFDFSRDPRSHQPHRKGKKLAALFTAKGCVNTCTFCHRWVKGYRVFPVENIIKTAKALKEKHNIGFLNFADECFGEDIRWLNEFIRQMAPLDLLFSCAGVRVGLVKKDPTSIRRLKEVGMVAIYFGMESGCDKILSVMEKRANGMDNVRAAKACSEAGVYTEIQLILGMPGENDDTVKETTDFAIEVTKDLPDPPMISTNYLQSLPGTPAYDFLQHYNLVGKSVDEEERYLLSVSDVNACEFSHYINVTLSPMGRVMTWQKKLIFKARIAWLKEHHWKFTAQQKLMAFGASEAPWWSTDHFKFILKTSPLVYRAIDFLGEVFWEGMVFRNTISIYGLRKAVLISLGFSRDDRSNYQVAGKSLKKTVEDLNTNGSEGKVNLVKL